MRLSSIHLLSIFVAAVVAAAGCHNAKRSTLEPCDSKVGVDCAWLHDSPCVTASVDHIQLAAADLTPPRTTTSPEATEIWSLSLNETIATALQNSEIIRTLAGGGIATSPGSFAGTSPVGAGIVATGQNSVYDPAIAESQIQTALAVFDAQWTTSVFWTRTDQPPGSTFGAGIPVPNQRDQASFASSLSKLFATGGTGEINFNTNYLFIPPFLVSRADPGPDGMFGTADDIRRIVGRPDAQYTPNVEFTLKQPLLKGAGTDFNRSPIVIARLQSDQSLWTFKEAVLSLVRSVEEAYWNLHAAHVALRSVEEVLPLAQEAVRITEVNVEEGALIQADLGQARNQFIEFRQQRVQAMSAVLDRETILRNLLGLPPSDGKRIVPSDDPLRVPLVIDWPATVGAALEHRPEVARQRLSVRVRELELLVAKNGLQPQFDVEGLWRINGLEKELDEAIGVLTDNQFTDWQLGVTLNIPIGYRQASAQVHAADLQLDKDRALLRQTVHATTHRLNDIVRELDSLYQQYLDAQQRRDACNDWIHGSRERFLNPPPGVTMVQALNFYLPALQRWSAATTDAGNLLAQYNATLARLEEAKGTLLTTNNIQLMEDPCGRVRLDPVPIPIMEPAAPACDESTQIPVELNSKNEFNTDATTDKADASTAESARRTIPDRASEPVSTPAVTGWRARTRTANEPSAGLANSEIRQTSGAE